MHEMKNGGARHDVGGVMMRRPFKVRRLGHFALWHTDLEAARRFHVELLGFRQTDYVRSPNGDPLAMFTSHGTDHHSFVAIHASTAADVRKAHLQNGIRINQISFQVGTLEEVAHAHAWFSGHDVPISRIGRDFPGSNWALYVFDPDGHRIELFYGMEQIGWTRRSKPPAAYLPIPFDVPSLPQPAEITEVQEFERNGESFAPGFRPEESSPHDFNVGGIRLPRPFKVSEIGPIGIFVTDIDRSERFYAELLGLTKTEDVIYRGHRCVYLRAGTNHHCVALIPVALRDTLRLDGSTSLLSFGVGMGSYAQLRDAVAFLKSHGVRFTDSVPWELHPGIERAAYAIADDGHLIQLYFGMEQIGWNGQPRPAASRQKPSMPWPEVIEESADTYAGHTIQGPMA